MTVIVCKFGGSSVSTTKKIQKVAEIIKRNSEVHQIVVVLSAMAGETARLMNLANDISLQVMGEELDTLLSTGEQVSSSLLAIALQQIGLKSRSFNAMQLAISTDSFPQQARIKSINIKKLKQALKQGVVPVVTGFQGVNDQGRITTLGRGGSDTTAVALAAALRADECIIYTDVEGVYSADPNIVADAKILSKIYCSDMFALSALGAKVLQVRAIELAMKYEVPLRILSTYKKSDGTLVVYNKEESCMNKVSGIAIDRNKILCVIDGKLQQGKFIRALFSFLDEQKIPVDFTYCDITDSEKDTVKFSSIAEFSMKIKQEMGEFIESYQKIEGMSIEYKFIENLAKLSVVGFGSRHQSRLLFDIFTNMDSHNIEIYDLYSSARTVSILIDANLVEQGARILHSLFQVENKIAQELTK